MIIISKCIALFVLLYAGTARSQDSLHVTLRMNSDTIRVYEDISFWVTMQSTYPDDVLIAPAADNGVINDTSRFVYYQLLRKEGKEYKDVIPFKQEVEYPTGREIKPDTLTRLKPVVFKGYLNRFHIKQGAYKLRIVCAVIIHGIPATFYSNWVYFYCSEHFSS